MEDHKKHINNNHNQSDSDDFFSKVKVDWPDSKEDVWNNMFDSLEEKQVVKSRIINLNFVKYAAAAVLLILVSVTAFMRFYSHTQICATGKHLVCLLPDGSKVTLNASSKISYNPYWWRFSRTLNFKGEAFFNVKKGEKFQVVSEYGKTSVLGTSFNIYSRGDDYMVTCMTGKVKVIARKYDNSATILLPNEKVVLNSRKETKVKSVDVSENSASWIDNKFVFTSESLIDVFAEIERQYAVKITCEKNISFVYTGNFDKDHSVENTLDLVCRPFGLKFVKISQGQYHVKNY